MAHDGPDAFWRGLPEILSAFPQIDVEIGDNGGVVLISSISCRVRGQGIGTSFMERVGQLADDCGIDISAEPADDDRVVSWYERLGFSFENSQLLTRFADDGPAFGP